MCRISDFSEFNSASARVSGHWINIHSHTFKNTATQALRVVVDTGSPLFGLFVSNEAVGKYTGTETGVAHRRPAPLQVQT